MNIEKRSLCHYMIMVIEIIMNFVMYIDHLL